MVTTATSAARRDGQSVDVRRVTMDHERLGPRSWRFTALEYPGLSGRSGSLRYSVDAANAAIIAVLCPQSDDLVFVEHRVAEASTWTAAMFEYRRARQKTEAADREMKVAMAAALRALDDARLCNRDIAELLGVVHPTVAIWRERRGELVQRSNSIQTPHESLVAPSPTHPDCFETTLLGTQVEASSARGLAAKRHPFASFDRTQV